MIGDRLGKWVIFKELGRGGMGRVYLAQEELTGRQAALKVLAAELAQEIGFLQRFQREIETLSKLDHPHIVRFYESGLENGHYFYAMEYVEGLNLDQMLEKHGRFAWKDVLSVALQIAPALKHCHDHGVIHRDLKPSNLIRTAQGEIKITDFGIAKVFAKTHLTATGGIVGTAEFLSPEQAAGKIVGKRSDLYCLGCVLYMLLTGRPPFTGNTYLELLHKHRYAQFDRPKSFIPDLPIEIDEVVCQLLEKDPEKRPRDAHVLYKQLKAIHKKLDRHGAATSADNSDQVTRAENRADAVSMEALPGPATLMSRLVRAELDEQQHGGTLTRFFNRPVVLVVILLMCIGVLTWKFWPLSQDELYERGAKLMETGHEVDMQQAWADYLDPLERDYPEHKYKAEVEELRQKWQAAKAPSEAQRFFQQGELLAKQGNPAAARQMWRNLIDAFAEVEAEKPWVERARRSLADMERADRNQDRFKNVRAALEQADKLRREGKHADAERIWTGIEQLYRNDPAEAEILLEVQKARQK
jgi:tRNA A-37 threonylcarbamoyl transferase component Bud32